VNIPVYAQTTIRDNLISCWSLDEEDSGIRYDSYDSNDLTDNNTVGSAPGKIDTAANFVATNTESLSHIDNDGLSTGNIDFALAAWVYPTDITLSRGIVTKYTATGDNREYGIFVYSSSKFGFRVNYDGITGHDNTVDSGPISINNWYFVIAEHDSISNTISFQMDNGAITSKAHTTGVYNGAATFYVGEGIASNFNGLIDNVVFWKRKLSADERTWLYNSGNGRACTDIITAPTQTPTPTATPTVTPTPSGYREVTLPSGNYMTLDRTVTYGDIAVVTAGSFLFLFVLIYMIVRGVKLWLR